MGCATRRIGVFLLINHCGLGRHNDLKKMWVLFSFNILWSIWLEKNRRIFDD